MTDFMASFVVPPIQISSDPADSAWLKLDSNPIALSLCMACICLWFLILIWARRRDLDDIKKAGCTPLPDNDPRDKYRYEVCFFIWATIWWRFILSAWIQLTFWTGRRLNAGTSANVSIILAGDEYESDPRLLVDEQREILGRGSACTFMLRSPQYLGSLSHLRCLQFASLINLNIDNSFWFRVYHDNVGFNPSWFLNHVLVHDLQADVKYFFINNRWLSSDDDDGMVNFLI